MHLHKGLESVPKHPTLDFYWHADLGLHLCGVFSSRYTVYYKAGCCRSYSLNPLNLLFNLDLKAAVKNVHKTTASVAQLWQSECCHYSRTNALFRPIYLLCQPARRP